jgi:hypothetical protein
MVDWFEAGVSYRRGQKRRLQSRRKLWEDLQLGMSGRVEFVDVGWVRAAPTIRNKAAEPDVKRGALCNANTPKSTSTSQHKRHHYEGFHIKSRMR